MTHRKIESEAKKVKAGRQKPRDVLKNPAPEITKEMLVGIEPSGKVLGYASGVVHRGTFYIECEGVTHYQDESFLRVIMYGDEFHDRETRIPLKTLRRAGFVPKKQSTGEGEKE